jgi:hypothetical protein
MIASIHYLLNFFKKGLFETFIESKVLKNMKNFPFVFLNKGTPILTFLNFFSLITHFAHWNFIFYKFHDFSNL